MKELFTFHTVRKKILLMSKSAGLILILSYIFSTRLPVDKDLSFLLWAGIMATLILVIDFLLCRYISKPVAKLNHAAKQMAALDLFSPCTLSSRDEFGELSASLNAMSQNLKQALEQLADANRQLTQDVEKERLLLAGHRELTDSLSHEMKTPLGIIRAYAEGLQDTACETQSQKYTQVIIDETTRLNDLLVTLLDLSALETGAAPLDVTCFDFVELVETAAGRLLVDAPDTDYDLQYELPEQAVFVRTDRRRMEQALCNLLSNARNNVTPGGILRLELTVRDGLLSFSVFNQGAPIPVESLPHIWTRFYRCKDASYSGSGLGLSIVAQILSMQNLSYGVTNLPDGVRFYFSLPVAAP